MPAIELVIFDIAGTIIEDRGEVLTAFRNALAASGIACPEQELKSWKGASKREVIRHFIERQQPQSPSVEKQVETTYQNFRTELESCYRNAVHPIPGAEATFEWCGQRGIRLATTTGFYSEIANLILDRTRWRRFFAATICSSDVARGRPAPFMIFRAMEAAGVDDVRKVINIGDTPLDLQAGTNAGVRGVIGVLTGAHKQEDLGREPHTHMLANIADLPSLIERDF